ncbi:prepilin peptidase [Thalassococcus sp. BH17M4-6]|uniref:prepilin peptidase n=1 Tax=Thalassococcus sp. BH17M4-6 TaxID=3413148 RepID=UPI003BE4E5D4
MPDPAAVALLLILVSPAIGSFLGVLIDRWPRGIGVITPRSACRSCATPLAPRDLIPILSFARNRGRCRHCGAAIPPLWLYTEIIATGAAVLAVILGQGPLEKTLIAAVLWTLWPLAVIDARHYRLPDPLTATLALLALAWALRPGGDPGFAAWGAVLGAGSFWLLRLGYRALRRREGLGLGDVKLMVGLGALVGPLDLAALVLVAALGALAAAALTPGGLRARRRLPFGTALCAAGAAVWLWQLSAI